MGIGTFGSFTQARLGIYAAQSGLSVTGNNIANINTAGYTRQKLDQSSFYAGGSDRYYGKHDIRVGNGVLCQGVSQLRDPYLDIRYRGQMSNVGAMDAKLNGLTSIQQVLDEVGKGDEAFGVLGAQLSNFLKQLENLSDQTGHVEYDTQVRSAAEALIKQFNSYANQLKDVYKNAETKFTQDVKTVNSILTSIRDLNTSIRKAQIHGDNALELRDQRNNLIDELSTYMKIDVIYSEEDIGGGTMIEKLTIRLGDANPDPTVDSDSSVLIDGSYAGQISIDQIAKPNPNYDANKPLGPNNFPYLDANGNQVEHEADAQQINHPNFNLTLGPLTHKNGTILKDRDGNDSTAVNLHDNDLLGSLQSQREMLTEAGEFTPQDVIQNVDPSAAIKRGIPYYQKSLDLLARQFAGIFNDANQGYLRNSAGNYVDANGKELMVGGQPFSANGLTDAQMKDPAIQKYIEMVNGKPTLNLDKYMADQKPPIEKRGGALFSNRGDNNDPENITASNISISAQWSKGPLIVNSFVQSETGEVASTDSSNIAHMIVLMNQKTDYYPSDLVAGTNGDKMFSGSFNEMWINMGAVLGNDMMVTNTQLNTHYSNAVDIDTSRSAVSGVDLNDEAMSLMQYSKSYNAACRLMTTLDSILDKLINGTGLTT